MIRSTAINLSGLTPPDIIEPLDYEALVKEMRDDLVARFPAIVGVIDLESEPARKLIEVFAYREMLLRARINDAARSLLLAQAGGADLDNLAANFGVARLVVTPAADGNPAVMESDERLRRRVLSVIEAYSVAGPAEAYVYHAMTAAPEIRDATAVQNAPGSVIVTLMASLDTPEPTVEQRQRVMLTLSDKTVRPLTDVVSVNAPEVVETPITAELLIHPGPDGAVVVQRAFAQLEAWLEEVGYLGRDLRRSAIFSRLHVEGVQSVNLTSPAEDILGGPRRAIKVSEINITIAGSTP